jgi:hypothetical protein
MLKIERDQLAAQLAAVKYMLASLPANDYLGRMGFEHRQQALQEKLDALRGVEEKRAQVALYFGGRALGSFQDLLSKVWGALDGAQLQYMGPIRDKDASHLHITSVVHGSFGFLLEELDEQIEPMFQSPLSKATDQAAEYIASFAGENEATFAQVIDTLNPRVFQSIRGFFGYLHKGNATLRLVEGERDQQFDRHAVERAWIRAEASDVAEDKVPMEGTLLGVIPMGRRFEFVPDESGIVIKGKIGERFSHSYLENLGTRQFAGKRWKAMLFKRTVTRVGREPYDQYTLLELDEIDRQH